jgi:uncharacterized protein
MVIPILIVACIIIIIVLLLNKSFNKKMFFPTKGFISDFKTILLRYLLGGAILFVFVYYFNNKLFLSLPKKNLKLWIMIIVLYPLLSAYPQEVIYRLFFFHRYKVIFKRNFEIILASGICFGLAHLFFFNFWAITLSTIGGILFAYTYSKSNSIIITSIEHGLWGDLIFTVGLGMYFYSGAI